MIGQIIACVEKYNVYIQENENSIMYPSWYGFDITKADKVKLYHIIECMASSVTLLLEDVELLKKLQPKGQSVQNLAITITIHFIYIYTRIYI